MGELVDNFESVVDERNFLDVLCALEKKYDVSSLRYEGTQYWPLLRMLLGFENDPMVTSSQGRIRFRDRLKKYFYAFASLFEDFIDSKNNETRKGVCDVYCLTHAGSRSLKIKGKYFDAFFSPLRHWCGAAHKHVSFYTEEFAVDASYKFPRSEKTAYIQKYVALVSLLGSFKSKRVRIEESDLTLIGALRREIELLGFSANSIHLAAIKKALSHMDLHKKRFSRVLKKKQPKVVLVVTYYNVFGLPLMAAANALGIKTLDLQHGVQGTGHFAYGSWGHVPEGGWEMLPKLFWNWTAEDVANINSWGGTSHRGVLGGRIFSQYLNEVDVEFPDYYTLTQRIKDSGCTQVALVSLQPIECDDFMRSLHQAMASPECESIFWLYRLHPAMLDKQEIYSEMLENERSDMVLCSNLPLDYVLKLSDLHITLSSSVTIEAALEGVPTLLDHSCGYYMDWQRLGVAQRKDQEQSWASAISQRLSVCSRFSYSESTPTAKKTILELVSNSI